MAVLSERISRDELKVLGLSSLGSVLEFYDFIVYGFMAPVLARLFFPPDIPEWLKLLQVFAIFALGYIIRPLGGILFSHFGDKVGRKNLFMLTIFFMAAPTFLIGLLPTYATAGWFAPLALLLCRVLQGFAIGGELPGAAVFVSEHVSSRRVGFACGMLFGSVYFGLFLGSFSAAMITRNFAQADVDGFAWRIPFLVGGVFGLISVYLRRYLSETPLFLKIKAERTAHALPLKTVFTQHLPASLFVIGIGPLQHVAITTLLLFMPTVLQTTLKLPADTVFTANSTAILLFAFCNPIWGAIGDAIGRLKAMAVGAALILGAGLWFVSRFDAIVAGQASLLLTWLPVAMAVGAAGLLPSLIVTAFPTEVRFTGFAVPYNIGAAIFAGLTPLMLTGLLKEYGAAAVIWPTVASCLVGMALALWASRSGFHQRAAAADGRADDRAPDAADPGRGRPVAPAE